jgi:hypothetical protein
MPATAHQNEIAADVERGLETNNTQLEPPMIQLVMTYRGITASQDVGEDLWSWVEARCEELGACPLSLLLGCAEFVKEME